MAWCSLVAREARDIWRVYRQRHEDTLHLRRGGCPGRLDCRNVSLLSCRTDVAHHGSWGCHSETPRGSVASSGRAAARVTAAELGPPAERTVLLHDSY